MNNLPAFGNNICVKPFSRNKIIGDTAKYYLYGEVMDVGIEVKEIKVGDIVGYVLWGLKEVEFSDGTKQYFIQEHSDFILGVQHAEIGPMAE